MEIKQYAALLWRWLWLIILGALIAGGTAFLVSINTTPVYQASSRLLIDEAPGSTRGNDFSVALLEQQQAQTYVEIINVRDIREVTIAQLGLENELQEHVLDGMVSVSVVPETQLLTIRVQGTNPEQIAAIANTIGTVFIEKMQEWENRRYAAPITNWQDRLEVVGQEIQTLETQINNLGETETSEEATALSRLETQLKEAQIRYTDAFNNLNDLQVSQAQESSNLVPIEAAETPQTPIRPRTRTNTLLATAVGALLAIGIIFLIEYLDDTIKSPQEISNDTDLSVLGTIAIIKGEQLSDRLITASSPRDPISEAYRVLRTNLSFSAIDGELGAMLITSSSPGEGKSTTIANMAVVMAQTGKRVIIVDSDLRRPIQHKMFQITNNQGLTTAILDKQTPITQHLQTTPFPDLRILTSGPIPPNPAELLNSQRMTQVIMELKQEADVVFFDTPPVLTVADASILAPRMHGSLIVVVNNKTRRAALVQSVERLHTANAHILGVVINKLNPGRISGYYYRYQYYYTNTKEYGRNPRRKSRLPNWIPGLNKR
ncbi:MAG: polysaccharide biosynthesis tyrosine autokinase [Chloroflexi bacterium]|nr:polysaccharide biosynthesis tyrosine autokinase [Chloroflexota bacterium]